MEQLDFLYLPVPDLEKALAFYRDTLGWKEGWREGETTASLQFPGNDAQLMLDVDTEGAFRPGPVLHVADVRAFHRQHADLSFWLPPNEIPGGWWAGFDDVFGNAVYILDQSTADTDSEAAAE